MPKSRPPYPPEFRRRMTELVRAGRTPEQLAKEFVPLRRLTPTKPAARMSRATRLRPIASCSTTRSLWMRGTPYVPRDRAWNARMRSRSAASAVALAEAGRVHQA